MPFDQVNVKDINNNVRFANAIYDDLRDVLSERDSVLRSFKEKMKALEKCEKEADAICKTAAERCEYHRDLKKLIESGQARKDREDDINRRVKDFIDAVKTKDAPRYDKAVREFKLAIKEIADALK